jgi:hypothetical protein
VTTDAVIIHRPGFAEQVFGMTQPPTAVPDTNTAWAILPTQVHGFQSNMPVTLPQRQSSGGASESAGGSDVGSASTRNGASCPVPAIVTDHVADGFVLRSEGDLGSHGTLAVPRCLQPGQGWFAFGGKIMWRRGSLLPAIFWQPFWLNCTPVCCAKGPSDVHRR